jgi:hypothetical protein
MNGADALDPRTLVFLGLKVSVLLALMVVHVRQRRQAWTLRRHLDRLGQLLARAKRGPAIRRPPVQPAARRRSVRR